MTIYDFTDYRIYLRKYIESLPKRGRGEINRMANAAGVHPSLLSQILSEEKNLSLEQTQLIAEYIDLTIQETEYLLFLVQYQRAGTEKLKKYFKNKLSQLKQLSTELNHKVRQDQQLTDEEKSIIYSHWIYLSIWLFTSIGDGKTLEDICQKFEISRERAMEILNFLISTGLCTFKDTLYKMGSQSIHIGRGSPHLYKHHTNWRLRAIDACDKISTEEMMYSAPMSISRDDFRKIKEQLAETIKKVTDTAIKSKAEDMVYFGLDFFWIKK